MIPAIKYLNPYLSQFATMMISRIIYCAAVVLATASVILLALFSPVPYRDIPTGPLLALSFFIQQPQSVSPTVHPTAVSPQEAAAAALIFHRMLTEGPENTSRVVGKAQGFIIPVESFAHSAFNIIYLDFQTPEFSGSISLDAKNLEHNYKDKEKLDVVGGTGAFAFARGHAFLAQTQRFKFGLDASYLLNLHLNFPY